jgi:hypothetical protein
LFFTVDLVMFFADSDLLDDSITIKKGSGTVNSVPTNSEFTADALLGEQAIISSRIRPVCDCPGMFQLLSTNQT